MVENAIIWFFQVFLGPNVSVIVLALLTVGLIWGVVHGIFEYITKEPK